jgi:hypothetical protein
MRGNYDKEDVPAEVIQILNGKIFTKSIMSYITFQKFLLLIEIKFGVKPLEN